ncbi:MAG: hypothetical protein SW833_24190 [Cyanobacteriota bacterium]|nr:hypothetical protein [Cyanobacteriota bacterium]
MNQEDRILLEQLNEVITHNPHLRAYQLSLRAQQSPKTPFFKTWLAGFLLGAVAATASIAAWHSIGARQSPDSAKTEKSSEPPARTITRGWQSPISPQVD